MSHKTRAAATSAARRVLAKMKSNGWEVRVWENMGWHWSLLNEYVSLHDNRVRGQSYYYAMVSDHIPSGTGLAIWTNTNSGCDPDPNEAARKAIALVRETVDRYQAVAASCQKILGSIDNKRKRK